MCQMSLDILDRTHRKCPFLPHWPCWPQPWAIEPSTPDFGLVFSHGVSYRQGKSWHGTLGTKKGFCAASHLQCDIIIHHSLSNFVQHHRWKQLAEERIRRSDLASDDSQAFRKSWQDGETASSHETCGSHEPYVLHGSHDMNQNTWNHMKSGVCF